MAILKLASRICLRVFLLPDSCPEAPTILETPTSAQAPATPLRLLAYVHLRNIHGSTGAGRTARQIAEHLALRPDVDLRILADRADQSKILPLVGQPWTSFRYHTFAAETSRQQARWFLTGSPAAETFWPEAQVVYCTGESFVPTRRARLVVTAHDAGYFEPAAHKRDAAFWRTRLKWELLFRRLARSADLFHTVSHFSAERLAHFFPSIATRLRPVHNGVTPHFFAPVPAAGTAFVEQSGLLRAPFVLVPGGLHFRKNAELILAASALLLQQFPSLVIAVVNHTNPVYAAPAAALGERFRLLGFVSDDALHALYANATIVWYPSRYEGFGLPVVEAMACGAAVVASNSSSIPEIAGSAALLVDPSSPQAHADAIASLLTDDRARQHFSALGRERARHFTWEATAAQLKQHFDTLI